MIVNYLNKYIVAIGCSIASMCVDAKGSEENDVNNVTPTQMKTADMQLIDHRKSETKDSVLNTSSRLSIALDQLVYSPLRNTKAFITSLGKFAYENPAMAAITTTYFMLPIVAAYAEAARPYYWSPQYCCTLSSDLDVSTPSYTLFTTTCSSEPATVKYATGFPGFSDQNSCMYDVQYNANQRQYDFSNQGYSITQMYSDPACTIPVDENGDYIFAFINSNTLTAPYSANHTPIQAVCVPHQ